MAIILNLLQCSVLVDLEVLLAEARNRSAIVIPHGGLQDYGISVHPDRVVATRAARGWRGGLRPGQTG